jgi:hypothetical protein
VASGKAKTRKKTKTVMAQPKTKKRPNQQKNKVTVNPGMMKPGRNKTANSKVGAIGGAVAAGAALAGGAAVMAMPAIWNDKVMDGGYDDLNEPSLPDDKNIQMAMDSLMLLRPMQPPNSPELPSMPPMPPIFSNSDEPIAPDADPELPPASPPNIPELPSMPSMPSMMWPADLLMSSDEPPNISPDADPAEAKEQKIKWLLSRVLQNKPYSLDDPKLNLTEEDKSYYAQNLPALPVLFHSMMGGPSLPQGAPDALKMLIPGTSDAA